MAPAARKVKGSLDAVAAIGDLYASPCSARDVKVNVVVTSARSVSTGFPSGRNSLPRQFL